MVNSVIVNPLCFGDSTGSITLFTTGGTFPGYTWHWSFDTTATDSFAAHLSAGTYAVTADDANNCADTLLLTITQNAKLQLSMYAQNIKCYGTGTGSILAAANGGTGQLTYSWSPHVLQSQDTALNLAPGIYTIVVTDTNGCSVTSADTITQPDSPLKIDTGYLQQALSCHNVDDAVILVQASGGTPQYIYTLSDGTSSAQTSGNFAGLGPGTDTVTVTDSGGCYSSVIIPVDSFVRSQDSLTTDSATCFGSNNGDIKLFSLPQSRYPFTYSLNGGPAGLYNVFDNLAAGDYTVVSTDKNNCRDTIEVMVNQPDSIDGRVWLNGNLLPRDSFSINEEMFADFTRLTVSPWAVSFSPNLAQETITDTSIKIQPQQDVYYTVTIANDSLNTGCMVTYKGEIIVTPVAELPNLITPNGDGFNDKWEIDLEMFPNASVTIFDRWGQVVFQSDNYNNDWAGTYQRTGKHVADGTYYYILKTPASSQIYKGDINVLNSSN
jgi:gliding motility-associated-like protein